MAIPENTGPPVADEKWAEAARQIRHALEVIGVHPDHCLPGERAVGQCTGTYAEHALAYLITMRAAVDHQLGHLKPPQALVQEIYLEELGRLEDFCERPGHGQGA